jgi:hypothetical protein
MIASLCYIRVRSLYLTLPNKSTLFYVKTDVAVKTSLDNVHFAPIKEQKVNSLHVLGTRPSDHFETPPPVFELVDVYCLGLGVAFFIDDVDCLPGESSLHFNLLVKVY